ncbi:hypothetical protein [Actinoplanes sp. RD1]|uniref:hypothetical protein n=1 Tax=Actinoplanes sp. RD1 TaxID=3064538 RepID=UPI0027422F17|nr:hypothetical protein [Actinoplanes sp. RD1]
MTDTKYASELDRRAHTQLERHLVVGANTYEISASGTGDETVRLHLMGWSPDGATVGEISGGISPHDLPEVAEALTSTLAGLVALRAKHSPRRAAATEDRPKRHPNQGARWSPEDDERLLTRWGEGAGERSLMHEFGRSRGGIRARLESLGAIEPGTTILYRDRPVGGAATPDMPDTRHASRRSDAPDTTRTSRGADAREGDAADTTRSPREDDAPAASQSPGPDDVPGTSQSPSTDDVLGTGLVPGSEGPTSIGETRRGGDMTVAPSGRLVPEPDASDDGTPAGEAAGASDLHAATSPLTHEGDADASPELSGHSPSQLPGHPQPQLHGDADKADAYQPFEERGLQLLGRPPAEWSEATQWSSAGIGTEQWR